MKKIRIGILCPSEIAYRRFMPAVQTVKDVEYVGVASADSEEWFKEGQKTDDSVIKSELAKAQKFQDTYGGKVFCSYQSLLESDEIDGVYIPLPPALHYQWAKKALQNGKHVFLEKPFTTSEKHTKALVELANENGLALHENYMFIFHSQLEEIDRIVKSGAIGDIRLYRIAFGFPKRAANDFRYHPELGGGALLDCGGYTLKLAQILLGDSARVVCSQLNGTDEFSVDIYGSATVVNNEGVTAQLAFGMDNSYKCDLEIWGSKGNLMTGRIFTAPAGLETKAKLKTGNEEQTIFLSSDDSFAKSINFFCQCIQSDECRTKNYRSIIAQSQRLEELMKGAPKMK